MRFVTIGDVHGRDNWKKAVYQNDKCLLGNGIDKVIFIGDYVDSFDLSNSEIFTNLIEIIELKRKYPDNVVLLWGNHDVAYLNYDGRISGFRYEMAPDLNILFRENIELFSLAYQYQHVIWTHAGIHRGWWNQYVQPVISRKKETRFSEFLGEMKTIAGYLNLMFEFNYEPLFLISHYRGGSSQVGGPLWADKKEVYSKPLPGYHQVVGHTPVGEVKTYDFYDLTQLTFCDCKDFYILDL